MNSDVLGPEGRRLLQRGAARWWWAPLVAAVAWFLLAWLVLRADATSLATVGLLIGGVFLLSAVNEGAMAAMVSRGWAVLHVVLAVFFVLGAVWAFVRPIETFFALASVLGLLLFLQGILTLGRGVAMRDETPHWWLEVLSGGLFVVLAVWVSSSDRVWDLAGRATFILLWVGFLAIFRGISDLMLAIALCHMAKEGEPRERAAAGADTAAIPPQERREAAPRDTPAESAPRS
jgi:uncharacterized membrane protein HdeD (DUF308 family)